MFHSILRFTALMVATAIFATSSGEVFAGHRHARAGHHSKRASSRGNTCCVATNYSPSYARPQSAGFSHSGYHSMPYSGNAYTTGGISGAYGSSGGSMGGSMYMTPQPRQGYGW